MAAEVGGVLPISGRKPFRSQSFLTFWLHLVPGGLVRQREEKLVRDKSCLPFFPM